jgi:hypothetical protein
MRLLIEPLRNALHAVEDVIAISAASVFVEPSVIFFVRVEADEVPRFGDFMVR